MKKQILFVNGHMNTGGIEKSLLDVLTNLNYEKYDVDLVLFEGVGDYKEQIPPQVNIIEFNINKTEGDFVSCIKKALQNRDFDVIRYRVIHLIIRFFKTPSVLRLMKKYWGIKKTYDTAVAYRFGFPMEYVAYVIDTKNKITWWHHGEYNYSHSQTNLLNKTIKRFGKIVFVSKACLDLALKNELDIKTKSLVIPNFIDCDRIKELSMNFNPYSSTNKKIFITVARLSPEKHIENAVFASKRLVDDGYDCFQWYIVGSGIQYEELSKLILKNELENYVFLLGNKVNPYPYISNADLYIHTSYVESQGISVLEAMSLNVPCIITRSMGTEEFVVDGKNALVAEQNVDDLVRNIKKALENEKLFDEFIPEERYTVNQYSSEIVMKKIEEIL